MPYEREDSTIVLTTLKAKPFFDDILSERTWDL